MAIFIPGLIVEEIVIFLIYTPFKEAGLAFNIALINVFKLFWFVGMSRRDMKVGPIETKMVGIDRKALGQIFKDFCTSIKLKNSSQITQQN